MLAAILEIGGTNARMALMTEQGQVAALEQWKMNAREKPRQALARMVNTIWEMAEKIEQPREAIAGFGLSIAAELNIENGFVYHAVNLGWRDVPVGDILIDLTDRPLTFEMDAHAAAIGEYHFGAGHEVQHMALVIVGTGIGAGFIFNGQPFRGHAGIAGEFGHASIQRDGPLCNCGRYGCLEALASGWAIGEAGKAALKRGEKTALSDCPVIEASTIFQAARQGDDVAEAIVLRAAQALGVGLVNLIHMLSPELIVLTGGVAIHAGSMWLSNVIDETERQLGFSARRVPRRILISRLGEQCGLLGMAYRVFEEHHRGKLL